MTSSRQYDALGRLTNIVNTPVGPAAGQGPDAGQTGCRYDYNLASQRVRATAPCAIDQLVRPVG